jgi:hypothetical protein
VVDPVAEAAVVLVAVARPVLEPRRAAPPSSSSPTGTRASSSPRARFVAFLVPSLLSRSQQKLTSALCRLQEHLLVTRNLVPGDSVYGEKVCVPTPLSPAVDAG